MNPAPTPAELVEEPAPKRSLIQRFLRYIYVGNPFYLLSVCFVFHGTAAWFQSDAAIHNPWPLMGLISAYVVALATTAFVIVRFGNVWDDARSIFVIVLILFVEMSLCFDDVLSITPEIGKPLLLLGLLLAMSVTEGLLLGLRIRLPLLLRLPLHAMLGLLFLYPLSLVPSDISLPVDLVPVTWRLFLFSPLAALLILTLVPAVRRGPGYVANNGTPWRWPLFPWTALGTLIVGLGVRTYTMTLSFDPVLSISLDEAMQMPSIFGGYFLVPIVLAVGVLLLETAIVTDRHGLSRLALILPFACLWLAIPSEPLSLPYLNFLDEFTQFLGSPLWLTLIAAAVYLTYALLRRVCGAEDALVICLLLLAFVGPDFVTVGSPVNLHAVPLALIAVLECGCGLLRRDSRRTLLGAICLTIAVDAATVAYWPADVRHLAALHLAVAATIVIGMAFRDPFSRLVRQAGAILLVALGIYMMSLTTWGWRLPIYTATLVILSFLYAWWYSNMVYFVGGLVITFSAICSMGWNTYMNLRRLPEWKGVDSFLLAGACLVVAVCISAIKGGFARRWIGRGRPRRPSTKMPLD